MQTCSWTAANERPPTLAQASKIVSAFCYGQIRLFRPSTTAQTIVRTEAEQPKDRRYRGTVRRRHSPSLKKEATATSTRQSFASWPAPASWLCNRCTARHCHVNRICFGQHYRLPAPPSCPILMPVDQYPVSYHQVSQVLLLAIHRSITGSLEAVLFFFRVRDPTD